MGHYLRNVTISKRPLLLAIIVAAGVSSVVFWLAVAWGASTPNIYATSATGQHVTNPGNVTGAPDGNYATLNLRDGNAEEPAFVTASGYSVTAEAYPIAYVSMKFRVRTSSLTNPDEQWGLRYSTDGNNWYDLRSLGQTATDWTTLSYNESKNRRTNAAWTWSDITTIRLQAFGQRGTDNADRITLWCDSFYVVVYYDTGPPTKPTNLQANVISASQIDLSWDASTDDIGVTEYKVYRTVGGNTSIFSSGLNTFYQDVTVSDGVTYKYEVAAYDGVGNLSPRSDPVYATTPDVTAPSSVTSTTYQALEETVIRVYWNPSTDNVGVSYYQLFVNTNVYGTINHTGVSQYIYDVGGFMPNTTHSFEVRAVDAAGNVSSNNAVINGTTKPDVTPPTAVSNLTATVLSQFRIRLVWDKSTDRFGVKEYRVWRDSTLIKTIADTGQGSYEYEDGGLTHSTTYNYEVRAVDNYGNISSPASVQATTMTADTTPPTPPGNLGATVISPYQVDLVWSASTDNRAVIGYDVYRSVNNGVYSRLASSGDLSYQVHYLSGNTLYGFYIIAYDEAGNRSNPSNTAVVTTLVDSTPPEVIMTIPNDGTTNVGRRTYIRVRFDDEMDASTFTTSNVYIRDPGNNTVSSSITLSVYNTLLTLQPASDLAAMTTFAVYLKSGLKNLSGLSLADYSWKFTTGNSIFFTPHGYYAENTNACVNCHINHTAQAPRLLRHANITSVCFTCHNGTGSTYVILTQFSTTGGNKVFHPVKNTPASSTLPYTGLFECINCHNPHSDKKAGGGIYPRLLKAWNGSNYVLEGNAYCLACHGPTNQNWSPTYYANTGGDHTNADAAHYDLSKPALVPSSGTQITCVQCHDKHGSPNARLNLANQENLCFNCHDKATNSMSGRNIKAEFDRGSQAGGSRHGIYDSDQADGTRIECVNCHGPHTVAAATVTANLYRSDLSDPDNTKKHFTLGTDGPISLFCLRCHDGSPPVAVVNTTKVVPYSVAFPNVAFTNNGTGWNKAPYTSSGHYTNVNRTDCTHCHEPHGSTYDRLRLRPEDTTTTDGICLFCHSGQNPSWPGAKNIKTDLMRASRHPTLYVSGKHFDTEKYQNMPLADRHAECYDCHDMHSASYGSGTYLAGGNDPPTVSKMVYNSSGVGISKDPAVRPAWTTLKADSPAYTFKLTVTYLFELCYKCHSSYSFGSSPPAGYSDISKEFNPNNPAYHPVEAKGKTPYGTFTGTDSFGNPINKDSIIQCTDCHGTAEPGGPKGVHGSVYSRLLKAPWTGSTGTSSTIPSDLCFRCHDKTVYGAQATNSSRSATGYSNVSAGNLHLYHVGRGYPNCQYCHLKILHGDSRPHLIALRSDPSPYIERDANGNPVWARINTYNNNDTQAYDSGFCSTSHAH